MTENTALDAPTPTTTRAASASAPTAPHAVFAAMGLTAIGAFLPWATVGDLSFRGTEGGGLLNLILAGIGLGALLAGRRRGWPLVLSIGLAALAALIVLVNLSDVGRLASGFDVVSVGSGLWVSAIGTFGWIAASLATLLRRRRVHGE